MAFDFAAIKAEVRSIVHETMAIPAVYTDGQCGDSASLRVRFHSKINRFGDLTEQGWAEIVEGVNRLIFDKRELDEQGVVLRSGGQVTLQARGFENIVLVLHVREPEEGPINVVWQVSKQ